MGSDLRHVMPLLRTINQEEDLRMNYQLLCSRLSISVQELQDTAEEVNAIEKLLGQEGQDLVLLKRLDLLNGQNIYKGVSSRGRLALIDVTASTNSDLIAEKDNLVNGDALVAEIQTQGRSLRGTSWVTSIGTNIMLSLAVKFQNVQQLLGFSLVVGVATVTALEELGVQGVKLKWPNDVVYKDKKLAGILIDTVANSSDEVFAIVGVGLNVHHSETIDTNIKNPHTDLETIGYNLSRDEVCIKLINEIKYSSQTFKRDGLTPFIDYWTSHDSLLGRQVEVEISSHRRVSGRVHGVNKLGELILESNNGRTAIRSGHITSIRA